MKTIFRTIPQLAGALSPGFGFFRLRLLVWLYYFFLSRKLGIVLAVPFKLTYYYQQKYFTFWVRHYLDIAVLAEVYLYQEYAWMPHDNPQIIIDLGAHIGDTALYYHARFPHARIIAVEPSPGNFALLQKNVAGIPQITAVQAALSDTDGTTTLNQVEGSLGHSVMLRAGILSSVVVDSMTMATLYKRYAITKADLIKFDIEGAEFALFAQLDPGSYAQAYIGEVHLDFTPVPLEALTERFAAFTVGLTELKPKRYLLTAY